MTPEEVATHPAVEVLDGGRWVSLRRIRIPAMGIWGYDFLHEDRCHGYIVAVLPFRIHPETVKVEYLLRSEITPCWDLAPIPSAITGGLENPQDPRLDVVRELEEEAGYRIGIDKLTPLGTCRGQKSSTNQYLLYTVNLTHVEQGTPTNDDPHDTVNEGVAGVEWVTYDQLLTVEDAQVSVMAFRMARTVGFAHQLTLLAAQERLTP